MGPVCQSHRYRWALLARLCTLKHTFVRIVCACTCAVCVYVHVSLCVFTLSICIHAVTCVCYVCVYSPIYVLLGFPEAQTVKNLPTTQKTCILDLWVRKIPWRREWLPTPVFLPEELHGPRTLVGYSPWGHKALDTAE